LLLTMGSQTAVARRSFGCQRVCRPQLRSDRAVTSAFGPGVSKPRRILTVLKPQLPRPTPPLSLFLGLPAADQPDQRLARRQRRGVVR
jgi:hypothetical protein